ncbi:hypothetical protein GCM10027418_06690 [Mariniluteicoccus endophyticus]
MAIVALGQSTLVNPPDGTPTLPVARSEWQGLGVEWRSDNGDVFDLVGRGIALRRAGVEGLLMPKVDRRRTTSPGRHGAILRGWRVPPREAFWPLHVWSDISSTDWLAIDRRFWASLHPDIGGWWRITTPGGDYRELRLFYADADNALDHDPAAHGWTNYGVTLEAPWPFWQGPVRAQQFAPPTQRNFFGGGALPVSEWTQRGAAAPFWISASQSVIDTTVTNPGDLPAWPTWRIHGPFTEAGIILDGHEIHWPDSSDFEAAGADEGLEIVTDPAGPSVRRFGPEGLRENLIHRLDRRDFAPIPAGDHVPFTVILAGAGWIELGFRPNYLRAW